MLYFAFLFSLVTSFLFVSPNHLVVPFSRGVVLFSAFVFLATYFKERKNERNWLIDFLNDKPSKILVLILVSTSGFLFLIASSWHFYHLTKSFYDSFLFHDADYIGISDFLLSIANGEGFQTHYYSETGGSYLNHHFAPGSFILAPFVKLFPYRMGLAFGCLFFYQAATLLWLYFGYSQYRTEMESGNFQSSLPFYLFWIVILNQQYLYRIGSSYHFEILVPFFAFFFFLSYAKLSELRNQIKLSGLVWLFLSLLLYLSIKEDISIYLFLFILPLMYRSFQTRNNQAVKLQISIICIILLWGFFVFLLYPFLQGNNLGEHWKGELIKEYGNNYKQIQSNWKSAKILIEVFVSGGSAIFTQSFESIGICLIYLIHFFSNRPWHHELYSYYSYSLLPMVLFTGVLLIKNWKETRWSILFLCIMMVFYKNSLDSNFPLDPMKILESRLETKKTQQEEFLKDAIEISKITQNKSVIYSQYNLSIFLPDSIQTKPLTLATKDCSAKNKDCLMLIAPELTDEELWPKDRILLIQLEFERLGAKKTYTGRVSELWYLPKTIK